MLSDVCKQMRVDVKDENIECNTSKSCQASHRRRCRHTNSAGVDVEAMCCALLYIAVQ